MEQRSEPCESGDRYRQLVELSPNAIVVHREGNVVFANTAAVKLAGARNAAEVLGKPVMEFIHPDSQQAAVERIRKAQKTEANSLGAEEFLAANGSTYEIVSQPVVFDGEPAMYVIFRDASERKRTENELHLLRVAVDASSEAIFLTDLEGTITFVNPEFTRLYGYRAGEVVGKTTPRVLKSGKMAPEDYRLYWQALLNKEAVKGELINRTKDGRSITVEGSANAVLDDRGAIVGFLAVQRDVSERKVMEAKLVDVSTHDVLTGLYNRRFFEEEMARLQRGRQFPVSIIMADLNRLKETNDREGHAAGDALIQRAAQVITSAFRAEGIIARIGGDEVAILLPGIDAAAAEQSVRRVQVALDKHNATQSGTPLSIAFGVSTAAQGASLGDTLIEADALMYVDKGRMGVQSLGAFRPDPAWQAPAREPEYWSFARASFSRARNEFR
jgi:diguanylate cyclase (GGDEF)-like protein/PAS domain S-box-containing protein